MANLSKGDPLKPSALPNSEYQKQVLGWAGEAVTEGDNYLQQQPGYRNIADSIDTINGESNLSLSPNISKNSSNHFGRIALSLTAGLTDIKPFWRWETFNQRYERQAQINNKLAQQWWQGRFIDQRHADCVRYAICCGCSYLSPFWDETISDLNARAEDPRDVLPVRPADNISIQNALGVIIRRARSVSYVKSRWPEYAHYIEADRESPRSTSTGRANRLIEQINKQLSPFNVTLFQGGQPKAQLAIPTVDLMHLYLHDPAKNTSSMPVQMGDPKANWSYVVEPGKPKYPRGRLIIFTRKIVLYDGPNIYWHGLFPVSKLILDPWPWTWLGLAPLWYLLPLQKALDDTLRTVDDKIKRIGEPSVIADKNSMSNAAWRKLNARRAGLKIRQNVLAGKGAAIVHEPDLQPGVVNYANWLIEQMEKISGSKDLSSLMQLGQVPSASTVEKIIQSMSPANRMRSRALESFITEFAQMTLSNFIQFYTPAMRMAILGPLGLTSEDFDFARGDMIPDFVNPEDFTPDGAPTVEALVRGPRPTIDRAGTFLRYFRYHVAPGSLLNAAAVDQKLQYLMLARMGLVDHWTLMEELGVSNVGQPPEGAETITQRLIAEAQMGLGVNISPVGRKASGQRAPRLVSKESR